MQTQSGLLSGLSGPACSVERLYFQTTLSENDAGYPVAELQTDLSHLGYYDHEVNSVMTPSTVAAVKAFQRAAGIAADGIVGPQTKGKLCAYLENRPWKTAPPNGTGGSGSAGSGGLSQKTLALGAAGLGAALLLAALAKQGKKDK